MSIPLQFASVYDKRAVSATQIVYVLHRSLSTHHTTVQTGSAQRLDTRHACSHGSLFRIDANSATQRVAWLASCHFNSISKKQTKQNEKTTITTTKNADRHTHTHARAHARTHTHARARIQTRTYTRLRVCTKTQAQTDKHTITHTHTYAHTLTQTHATPHTQTHTHSQLLH